MGAFTINIQPDKKTADIPDVCGLFWSDCTTKSYEICENFLTFH